MRAVIRVLCAKRVLIPLLIWLASLGYHTTYYGDHITVTFRTGFVAVWWGGDAGARNTGVLNNFDWPYEPGSGAGLVWSPDWRWETYGPRYPVSRETLGRYVTSPKSLGLYWPRFSVGSSAGMIGFPFWIAAVIGVGSKALSLRWKRRQPEHCCQSCGYDLRGLRGDRCPECGVSMVQDGDQMIDVPESVSVAHVNDHGFAAVQEVIAPARLDSLRAEFDRVIARGGGRAGSRNPLAESEELRALAISPAVRRIAEAIAGVGAFPVRSLLFDKREGANWDVTWHRDTTIAVRERRETAGYGPWSVKAGVVHVRPPVRVLGSMVTIRLHLDDCDEDNGALLVVPGSHREMDAGGAAIDLSAAIDGKACEEAAVACPVRGGGALVMRPLLLHASKRARQSGGRRRVVHLEFAGGELEGGLEWAERG